MKIKAVVFPEKDKYEVRELTLPPPGPEDIEVKTLVSAISPGTERWVLRGSHIGTKFPCVPGYHRIGIVESRGSGVKTFEPGDIVYGTGNSWEENVHSMWGAHVSASVSAASGYKFIAAETPGEFEMETSAFTILSGVALRGINACMIKPGERIIIIGGGFIGICAAQLAEFKGADAVIIDKDPERVRFAGNFTRAFSIDDESLPDKLNEACPEGADVLYDSAGAAPATDLLVKSLKPGARLLLQAQYFDRERCAIDLDAVKLKEITIKTTCGVSNSDWRETLALIRSRTLDIGSLITHRFKSEDILKGYELLDNGKSFNMGIVFNWEENFGQRL